MKTRIISAAVAIALLVAVMCVHNTVIFNIAFALIGSLMVYELFGAYNEKKRVGFLAISIIITAVLAIMPRFLDYKSNFGIYILCVLAYICISISILLSEHKTLEIGRFATICGYTVLIAGMVFSISVIEVADPAMGLENLVVTFCGAWLADTGAYFVGTFLGKHKLCPEISPKKTVEGLVGGIVSNALFMMLAGYILSVLGKGLVVNYGLLAVLGIVNAALGTIGDLTASLMKRECGIKDFGKIMPGHGGALDRFDSMVFVAPFMAAVLSVFNIFGTLF